MDHFKRLNDRFGYALADEMLKRVAEHLRTAASDFFAPGTHAYRAHGDEFFMVGPVGSRQDIDSIQRNLDHLRETLARVAVVVEEVAEPMTCTVSVGMVASDVLMKAGDRLTPRSVRLALETAVAHAKRKGRNRLALYDQSLQKTVIVSVRDNCPACESSFTFDAPTLNFKEGPMFCPNCANQVSRPEAPITSAAKIRPA